MQKQPNWRKIWRAMHDLHYKQSTSVMASMACISAGLSAKEAIALCDKTQADGYVLSREIPKQN